MEQFASQQPLWDLVERCTPWALPARSREDPRPAEGFLTSELPQTIFYIWIWFAGLRSTSELTLTTRPDLSTDQTSVQTRPRYASHRAASVVDADCRQVWSVVRSSMSSLNVSTRSSFNTPRRLYVAFSAAASYLAVE